LERRWYAYPKDSWFAMLPSGGTQSKGYSDIQKKEVDYTKYSEDEGSGHARVRLRDHRSAARAQPERSQSAARAQPERSQSAARAQLERRGRATPSASPELTLRQSLSLSPLPLILTPTLPSPSPLTLALPHSHPHPHPSPSSLAVIPRPLLAPCESYLEGPPRQQAS
jgi:hypothetical protein